MWSKDWVVKCRYVYERMFKVRPRLQTAPLHLCYIWILPASLWFSLSTLERTLHLRWMDEWLRRCWCVEFLEPCHPRTSHRLQSFERSTTNRLITCIRSNPRKTVTIYDIQAFRHRWWLWPHECHFGIPVSFLINMDIAPYLAKIIDSRTESPAEHSIVEIACICDLSPSNNFVKKT